MIAANSLAERDAVWIITTGKVKGGQSIAKFDDKTNSWIQDKSQPTGAVFSRSSNVLAVD